MSEFPEHSGPDAASRWPLSAAAAAGRVAWYRERALMIRRYLSAMLLPPHPDAEDE